MKHLNKFNGFQINEELRGLAMPTLILSDFLTEEADKVVKDFLNSTEQHFEKVKRYDIKSTNLFRNEEWPYFPVNKIKLEFKFTRVTNEEFTKRHRMTASQGINFVSTGWCENLDSTSFDNPIDKRVDHTINLSLGLGWKINENFNEYEDLMMETEATILHELNHAYEGYNRLTGGFGQVSTDVTFGLEANRSRIKKEIFDFWLNRIGFYLYWSESHEINAMVQEAWPYVKRLDVNDMIKKCPTWQSVTRMKNFNGKLFRKEIDDLILGFYPDINTEFLLNRLKNGFANWLDIEREQSIYRSEDKPSLSGEKIRKMSFDKFLEVIEDRVKLSGERLRRGILKLYSIKNEKN
jgi:hypothetical protein